MPTQIIQYQCNKCFQTYLNEQTAIDCENSHYALNDFQIVKVSKEESLGINFPRSVHILNRKSNKTASYVFNHNKIKPNKRPLKNHYGYRFNSGIFPSEEEAE